MCVSFMSVSARGRDISLSLSLSLSLSIPPPPPRMNCMYVCIWVCTYVCVHGDRWTKRGDRGRNRWRDIQRWRQNEGEKKNRRETRCDTVDYLISLEGPAIPKPPQHAPRRKHAESLINTSSFLQQKREQLCKRTR